MIKVLLMLAAGWLVTQAAILTTTVYLHRALAHRALTIRNPSAFVFRLITWLTTGMKPREWVAVHRRHHAFTDEPLDPHSPAQLGWLRVQLTNAALYRRVAREPDTVERYAKDLPADKWDRWLFDRAFVGLGIGIVFLCLTLGVWWGLGAALFHTVAYLMLAGGVNAVGHTFGRRPYDNSATNLQSLALVSGGEGLHNNHHAAPTSAKLALHRGEIDPGWWLIRALRATGQAKVRLDRVVFSGKSGERAA